MLQVLIGLIVIPTAIIWLWNKVLTRMNTLVWDAYRYTGIVGTPIHELSHAMACFIFGMKIQRIALYAPNALTGNLGYVRFSYRKGSAWHTLGRVVQGVAPLITAAVGLVLVFDLPDLMGSPGTVPLWVWVWESVLATLDAAGAMLVSGWEGAILVTVLAVLALHLIPSVSDIQISLGALVSIILFFAVALLAADLIQGNIDRLGFESTVADQVHYYLGLVLDVIERILWMGVLGVTAALVMALLGSTVIVILPALIRFARDWVRGVRGEV